jgi:hypothetical protein
MRSVFKRNVEYQKPHGQSAAWAREVASDEKFGIDSDLRDGFEEGDPDLEYFEREENEASPSFEGAGLRSRVGAVLGWTAAMAILAVGTWFAMPKIAAIWTSEASGHVQDAAPPVVQLVRQGSTPEARAKAPVEAPKPAPLQLVVGQGSSGGPGEAIPMKMSLSGAPGGATLVIGGLAAGSTLNVGHASGANGWQLMAAELSDARIRPPQGYVGVMQLGLELRHSDDSVADRKALRLEWVAPPAPVAQAAPPAPVAQPAPAAQAAAPAPVAQTAPPAPLAQATAPVPAAPAAAPAPAAQTAAPAPVAQTAAPAPVPQKPKSSFVVRHLDPEEVAALVKRGEAFVASGDLASARLVLQRAAEAGEAQAALSLAETYDPSVLEKLGFQGPTADVEKARYWYERAQEFGSSNASARLQLLASRAH